MKKVLVVEDEEDYRKILKVQLVSPNYEIYFAKNGKEGLDAALKDHPEVIILDIVMPVMDGITMLDDLRKDKPWGADVNVIILTNLDIESGIRRKAVEEHHSIYLVKSDVKMEELDELINNLLDGKKISSEMQTSADNKTLDNAA